MTESNEELPEPSLAQLFGCKRKKSFKRKAQRAFNKKGNSVNVQAEDSSRIHNDRSDPRVSTLFFDYSVDNFFKAMDMIDKLCGEEVDSYLEQCEIRRLSASVTFLREWRHFQYEPRSIRFACGLGSPEAKDAINCINLPQFSSAAVPEEGLLRDVKSHESRDSLLYVGGPVWALDWCPQIHLKPDSSVKCEFLAVAAHPPGASYHKMGSPLTGRGLVQIWCILNSSKSNGEAFPLSEKSKRGRKNKGATNDNSTQIKRPRGRPRKNPIKVAVNDMNSETHCALALVPDGVLENVKEVCPPVEKSKQDPAKNGVTNEKLTQVKKRSGRPRKRPRKNSNEVAMEFLAIVKNIVCNQTLMQWTSVPTNLYLHAHHEDDSNYQPTCSSEEHLAGVTCPIPEYVALPRIVLCLAHNGKVAWDVKWRPSDASDSICKHRMGYLAVLLGNGSLEVWEVPSHLALRAIYKHEEATDPRFIKLEPVFKCSMLKRGGLQSIPLTVEWSVSPPHDYLLAGCHDGTVALWKFSRSTSLKCDDTRPLLCFAGDTVPIRAVAWAPFEGDPESSNIILTAGHEGMKFWDLRDPFNPLRKIHPVPRIIYSLDWLSNPSCIIMTFEDGTMRTLSLAKAANDLPVSGKRSGGKKQPGLHSTSRSSFAIWSVHVSRITGMVAYCSADGSAIRFQLTTKEVEADHARSRVPHFLCGSLSEEESTLTVSTSVLNVPFPMKKSFDKGRHTASSFRGFLYESNVNGNVNDQTMTDSNSNPDSQALVLYDGDNSGLEVAPAEAPTTTERPTKLKSGGSNKKKPVDSKALVCVDDETAGGDNEVNEGSVPEAFPPKIVALHRVRWNMNKGSERWLCYGGAGGVVRCQEIVLSDIDKKYAAKR
ncbi:hypothetical protein K1719_028539 [Acacia pycnantha]|nr:hypothetical protein K1719_028539 [Acacia pycnantha]